MFILPLVLHHAVSSYQNHVVSVGYPHDDLHDIRYDVSIPMEMASILPGFRAFYNEPGNDHFVDLYDGAELFSENAVFPIMPSCVDSGTGLAFDPVLHFSFVCFESQIGLWYFRVPAMEKYGSSTESKDLDQGAKRFWVSMGAHPFLLSEDQERFCALVALARSTRLRHSICYRCGL